MWRYSQSTGQLTDNDGGPVALGYSGRGDDKNDPEKEHVPNKGPIPRGFYRFLEPVDTPTHGPFVIGLVPHQDNKMFGRSGFLIHGDSLANPGDASRGCIVVNRFARNRMWKSEDHDLEVTN